MSECCLSEFGHESQAGSDSDKACPNQDWTFLICTPQSVRNLDMVPSAKLLQIVNSP